jgi:caffeoyl-CoA O-methyltransferase
MGKGYGQGEPAIAEYVEKVFAPEDELLADVRRRSAAAGLPDIAVGALDGLHLEVIARATAARRAVEIGTLGGYSGTWLLRGMGPEGRLDTFELAEAHAEVARQTFRLAGLARQARVHVGPALARLGDIEDQGPFDLVFIDADKPSYPLYLAWAADHLRLGGVVLGDNAFFHGTVGDASDQSAGARAMRAFNEALARGGRFRATMLPTGEGLAMGVKVR